METHVQRRALPDGTPITELGLGAAQFGNLYRETSDAASWEAVDAAWEAGVRYFDTAPHYGLGLSERRLGAALRDPPRAEYLLSTKVGRIIEPNPDGAGRLDDEGFAVPATLRRRWDFSRDGILRSIEESLGRLGLDRIDIVYLHDPDEHWEAASTTGVAALVELRDQGVIRAIGAGMNQSAMLAEFVRRCDVDLMMCAGRYTLLEQGAADDLLPAAVERGVGIVAAGVYNSGLLSRATVPDDASYDYGTATAGVLSRARAIAAVCERHGVELPEAAVQFPLRHPAVVSVVLGTRTAEQLRSGVERLETPIPDALWSDLVAEGLLDDPAAA
jgi:D-threo-aldose 1-dehydrogenase